MRLRERCCPARNRDLHPRHAEPNGTPLPLRKAVVTVTNYSIFRALCRSQLRAVRREKPCPSGSRLPRRGRFCASMHPGVTCCRRRARNGSVFWRKRLWSTKLISLASRQTCRSRRAAAPVSHAPASQRGAPRPVQRCYSRNVITPFRSVVSVVVLVVGRVPGGDDGSRVSGGCRCHRS